MQTDQSRFDQAQRRLTCLASWRPDLRLREEWRRQRERLGTQAMPAVISAWIAAQGQPSPMTAFALALLVEIGSVLLRGSGMLSCASAWAGSLALALAALAFQLEAGRQGLLPCDSAEPAPRQAKWRPGRCAGKPCGVTHFNSPAATPPQGKPQHPPRRSS